MLSIPKKRLILYALFIGLFPIAFSLLRFVSLSDEADVVQERITEIQELFGAYKKRQSVNIATINHFREADHFYLDKHLETITLLEPEIEALQKIAGHKNFPGDPVIKKRLDFLTGSGNTPVFNEGTVQSFPLYQETVETLAHPVEANINDIKNILAKTEGVSLPPFEPIPSRPQLIVLDFKLERKRHPDGNEVFVLNMKLLKREFL
ncbi:hypothetical protein [Estrella lausannensis]|uniref:Conserved putative secreted protein n=1 Tax=Estrella lausannensis TaxID=483423 RepID=A0A0H5DN65_9BACT|nr:hypothetical protein [Estrella lausannensis]CRX37542.1 Conserved putative secreted protein [Estrella lausannensis]